MSSVKYLIACAILAAFILFQIINDANSVQEIMKWISEDPKTAIQQVLLYDPEKDACVEVLAHAKTPPIDHRPTTTVIITSNLIPTMPSTDMLVDVLDSLSYIKGLEPNTPIIITVDGIMPEFDTEENRKRLMEWSYRVRHMFRCHPNVQILTSAANQGHRKSIEVAIRQVTTEFILMTEHDFPFIKEINLPLVIKAIRAVPELRIVRFNQRENREKDATECVQNLRYDDMDFILARWSNNPHFTTRDYYHWHMEVVKDHDIPEWAMMH
jgi:hypothetical protein